MVNLLHISVSSITVISDGDPGSKGAGEFYFYLIVGGITYTLAENMSINDRFSVNINKQIKAPVQSTKVPVTFYAKEQDGPFDADDRASATINIDLDKDSGPSNWQINIKHDGIEAYIKFSLVPFPPANPQFVTAYKDIDGRGKALNLVSHYTRTERNSFVYENNFLEIDKGIGNDSISSIYIPASAAVGFQNDPTSKYLVEIFEHKDFSGRKLSFTSLDNGKERLINLTDYTDWNGLISSTRVFYNPLGAFKNDKA